MTSTAHIISLESPLPWQCLALITVVAATVALVFSSLSRRRLRRTLEVNLRDEARLRTMLTQMPAVVWTTDRDLRITSSEGAGLEPIGIKPGQVVGMTLQEYFKTSDPSFVPLKMHLEALAGRTGNYEIHWKSRTYLAHCEPLRDADRQICGVIVAALDITVSKTAERKLARAEAKHRALLQAIPDVMFSMTRDGRIVEFVDRLMAPADYAGKDVADVFPAGVALRFVASAADAIDHRRTHVVEYQTGGDGDAQRFFEARVVGCCGDEVLVIVRNITERKRVENDLRFRESQLRSLVKAVPDLMFQFTRDGRFAGVVAPNPDDLILPADQLLGRTIDEILPPHAAHLFSKHLRAAVETGRVQIVQYPLLLDGETRWFEGRIVFSGDESDLVIAVVRNITDLRNRLDHPSAGTISEHA